MFGRPRISFFFFFNDTATTEIYTLSLHDALPIFRPRARSRAATGDRDYVRERVALSRPRGSRGPERRRVLDGRLGRHLLRRLNPHGGLFPEHRGDAARGNRAGGSVGARGGTPVRELRVHRRDVSERGAAGDTA